MELKNLVLKNLTLQNGILKLTILDNLCMPKSVQVPLLEGVMGEGLNYEVYADGTQTEIKFEHGFDQIPSSLVIQSANRESAGWLYRTVDEKFITVVYEVAPRGTLKFGGSVAIIIVASDDEE